MRKCSSTILYAACTFRPYKSTPVLKLFRTFTGKMTRGLSLRMVFSLLFQDTLLCGVDVSCERDRDDGTTNKPLRYENKTLGNPFDTMKRFCLYSQCSHLNL